MSLPEKLEELNREVGAALERALADMRRELITRLRSSNEEALRQIESFTPDVPPQFVDHADLAASIDQVRTTSARDARANAFGDLLSGLRAVDRALSQTEILRALLDEGRRFSSRTALLLLRDGQLQGWEGRGWDDNDAVAGLVLSPPANGAWAGFHEARAGSLLAASEAALLASKLESSVPEAAVALPLILRDRVVAVMYADFPAGNEIDGPALQLLTLAAAHAIEVLPFRERTATSTLADLARPGETPSVRSVAPAGFQVEEPKPAAAPEPIAEPIAEPESVAVPEPEPDHGAAAPAADAGALADLGDATHAGQLSELWSRPEAPEVPASRVDFGTGGHAVTPAGPAAAELGPPPEGEPLFLDDSMAAPARQTTELPLPEFEASEAEEQAPEAAAPIAASAAETTPIPSPSEPARPRPVATPPPVESSGHETVLLPRPGMREVLPSPWARTEAPESTREVTPPPAAPPAPRSEIIDSSGRNPSGLYRDPTTAGFEPLRSAPINTGTPEVRPPSGVQGPGWAFATTRVVPTSSEEVAHEEARRLARLLVSEIKLYNEEQVEAGRRNRDIYERLREDIDRSRQMYEERVEPRLAKSTDYFYQELVRILAAGDAKALGI
jgi:hypothetical protein